MRERVQRWIEKWTRSLGIKEVVETQKISRWAVINEKGGRGSSLIGITVGEGHATLLHTRKLTQEDIVHELLHVSKPEWSEEEVRKETANLLGK